MMRICDAPVKWDAPEQPSDMIVEDSDGGPECGFVRIAAVTFLPTSQAKKEHIDRRNFKFSLGRKPATTILFELPKFTPGDVKGGTSTVDMYIELASLRKREKVHIYQLPILPCALPMCS
jgi:hypothetical protein